MIIILRRILAYYLDALIAFGVIMLVLQLLILAPLRESIGIDEAWFHNGVHTELYTLLTISLPVWLYFTFMESSKRKATLGKRMLKLKVVSNGKRIGFGKAFLRTFFKLLPWELSHIALNLPEPIWFADEPQISFLSYVSIALGLIYLITATINPNHQTPYDRLLGIQVISRKQ